MTTRKDMFDNLWPGAPQPSIDGLGASPGFRPARSSSEARAEDTTRVAREMTDSAAEQRHARTARLKQARLEREAAEASVVPAPKVKAKAKAKKAG
jgi:hypothetical protein